MKRKIVKIDQEKCNGCGLCIPNCQEGAIQIIDNKARLISDVFCDGLGACLGHCPQGAIAMEEREAQDYDEKKVMAHQYAPVGGCPGTRVQATQLRQWPVQLMLVPAYAPYLNNADLLIAADCVGFSYAGFHHDLLQGKTLLVGCPKLDDLQAYRQKIQQILGHNTVKSITYARMEVPCCSGLTGIIQKAIAGSGKEIHFQEVIIGVSGEKIQ
jgi:NAD-dependent dihydropyrimidine dehydrogenase PreA subunit